ncbi:Serine/threonine-protein phosphatase CPPED1 [Halotydeus destructor]|nr:Serine/threonine-protein phosphatase CPPED1 [Halotydeus destructor]
MSELRNSIVQRVYSKAENEKWSEPFVFIQGADCQLGMIESLKQIPNPGWDEEMRLIKEAVEAINTMTPKPKFFIVCGDLVNAMPNAEGRHDQMADFKKAFSTLDPDIPLVCVCGNHDVGDCPTPSTIQGFRDNHGQDYFKFYVSGCLMVVLNSQFFENRSLTQDFAEEQDRWLDETLEEASSGAFKHVILFQHIPWFLKSPDEEKEYFNIENDLRMKMLNKIYDSGVRFIFCGHYHRNTGGMFKDLELVVTSAIGAQLGDDGSGLRLVKVAEGSVNHRYYAMPDIPQNVQF